MNETVNDDFELGVGAALRDARVARNLSLAEVSALLRIREAHLEAIELEDFEQLPGNVYAIGFIRTYAQYLELNESDMIMRFKAASVESGMADMVFEEEETEQISGALKISLLVVGALVVYVLWLVAGTQNDGITVSAVVQTPAAPVQAPAAPTQPAVVADEAAAASAAAAETPATPRALDGAAPAAATIEGPADVQPNAQLIDTTP
ncbi:MAG: helix-turn-helix domain-containing protein, partial [Pseudomonadota bacterium]|nr:helix-turn-helix domain-containing protein [Pseudomonadota bacterium]